MKGTAILIFLFLVIADRVSKILYNGVDMCNILICIAPSTNTGAAFGILEGFNWLFILVGLFVILLIINAYGKCKTTSLKIALILIVSGTLSNMTDRLLYGYVQDFIAFGFMPQLPSFNLADAFNCTGAVILIWRLITNKKLK